MNQESLNRLSQLTKKLLDYNHEASEYYSQITRIQGVSADFLTVVKPFADKVLGDVESWEPLVNQWIKASQPKYIYPPQIQDTCENLTIISVTAFQKDTRRRRFINTISAIDHVLEGVLKQLPDE